MGRDILKENSLKRTKSREAVLEILCRAQKPMTAEEVYLAILPSMSVALSTTYRVLHTLTEKDVLRKTMSQDGLVYFQMKEHQHNHTLKCVACNQVALIEDCPLELLETALEQKTGFRITGHNLEFSGLCPQCAGQENHEEITETEGKHGDYRADTDTAEGD